MSTTNLHSPTFPQSALTPDENEFLISRTFEAPRELLWELLTQPQHLRHWWGPKGFEMAVANVDLRPGGLFHYCLKHPNGSEMWGKWVFTEIVPPEYIGYVSSFSDAEGGTIRHPMSEGWPLEMLSSISLDEEGGRTTMTIRSVATNASDAEVQTFKNGHSSMQQGFGGTLSQLEEYLKTL